MNKDLQSLWKELGDAVGVLEDAKAKDDEAKAVAAKTAATYEKASQEVSAIRAELQATMDKLLPPANDRVRIS